MWTQQGEGIGVPALDQGFDFRGISVPGRRCH
jgi:hypothetical protein